MSSFHKGVKWKLMVTFLQTSFRGFAVKFGILLNLWVGTPPKGQLKAYFIVYKLPCVSKGTFIEIKTMLLLMSKKMTRKRSSFDWQCPSTDDDQLREYHKGRKWDGWTSLQYLSSAPSLSPTVQSEHQLETFILTEH